MQKFNYKKITPTDLILEVDINNLTREEQVLIFGETYTPENEMENAAFVQEEDFIFEINTLLYLELDTAYRFLKKGNYPMRFIDEKLQVLLSLSTN